jgi:hypothetical protein
VPSCLPPRSISPARTSPLTHATTLAPLAQPQTPPTSRRRAAIAPLKYTSWGGRYYGRCGTCEPPHAPSGRRQRRRRARQCRWSARSAQGGVGYPRSGREPVPRRLRDGRSGRLISLREIAAPRSLQGLRGGSRRPQVGPAVAGGRAEAGWQVGSGSGEPWWSPARVMPCVCHIRNGGDTFEIASPVRVIGVAPNVSSRVL